VLKASLSAFGLSSVQDTFLHENGNGHGNRSLHLAASALANLLRRAEPYGYA
jgi:hypothetical protein